MGYPDMSCSPWLSTAFTRNMFQDILGRQPTSLTRPDGMDQLTGTAQKQAQRMPSAVQIEIEMPDDLAQFRLPDGVQERLTTLLDKQDGGQPLADSERREAEGLVNLADLLSLLRLRAKRVSGHAD
jgi:hypothetical protein